MINKPFDCKDCELCRRVCPNDAITIVNDNYRTNVLVDKSKCTGCFLCKKICPIFENQKLNIKNQPFKDHRSVGILCFTYDNKNYGANMVPFAMYTIVKKLGYNPQIIDFNPVMPRQFISLFSTADAQKFRENFIKMTCQIKNPIQLNNLNNYFDTFIVGSDQVWNCNNTKEYTLTYYLDFVQTRKNIIAFSASFGSEYFIGDKKLKEKVKPLLERFDAISLREVSGVDLIKNEFSNQIECQDTIDPTLLVDVSEYEKVIKSEFGENNAEVKPYIAYYMLSNQKKKNSAANMKFLNKVAKESGLPIVDIRRQEVEIFGQKIYKYSSYPKWLNYIKNAKFVITDSFHGVCFCTIFKKNFIYVNQIGGITRLKSILSKLHLDDRIFDDFDKIDFMNYLNNPIDYSKVDIILNQEKQKALNFLRKALDKANNSEFVKSKFKKEMEEDIHKTIVHKLEKKLQLSKFNLIYLLKNIGWYIYLKYFPQKLKDKIGGYFFT